MTLAALTTVQEKSQPSPHECVQTSAAMEGSILCHTCQEESGGGQSHWTTVEYQPAVALGTFFPQAATLCSKPKHRTSKEVGQPQGPICTCKTSLSLSLLGVFFLGVDYLVSVIYQLGPVLQNGTGDE